MTAPRAKSRLKRECQSPGLTDMIEVRPCYTGYNFLRHYVCPEGGGAVVTARLNLEELAGCIEVTCRIIRGITMPADIHGRSGIGNGEARGSLSH